MLKLLSRPVALNAIVLTLIITSHAVGQSQQTPVISLGPLFESDLATLKPNEKLRSLADQAGREPPECADGLAFRVVVNQGDQLFADTLARAREEAIEIYLDKNYGLKKGRNFVFGKYVMTNVDDVQARYSSSKAPTIKTQSNPRKGTAVTKGDVITVSMTAADDADQAQGGLRSITLIDREKNGIVPTPWYAETAGVAKCTDAARKPPALEVRYIVPANPPDFIQLDSVAEDFGGKVDRDLGLFPTGDWHGTMKLKRELPAQGYEHTLTWMFSVREVAGSDQVRGSAYITIDYSKVSKFEECTFAHNIAPPSARLNVTGQRIGDRLIIKFPDPGLKYTVRQTCERGFDETEERPFDDVERDFDIGGIGPAAKYPIQFTVPPIDQQNRVTITMELFRGKAPR